MDEERQRLRDDWIGARCAVCGGPIIESSISGGLIHVEESDWVDNVHQAVPAST